jgi:outer membrane protein insertion porin family
VRSVYALQDLYRDQGYLKAEVRIEVQTDPLRKTAAVVFRCTAGQRATVGSIVFEGEAALPFTQAELESGIDSEPGGRYLAQTVREDADRLRTWLVRKDYRLAEVDAARSTVNADSTQVDLVFPLRLGPKVVFELEGADLKKLKRHDLLPFLSDEGYDEALVLQSIDLIRKEYQSHGYYHVKVDRDEERSEAELRLRFTVDPGEVYTLDELAFSGNTEITSDRLQELVTTTPHRLLRPGSGRLIDEVLKEDLANLRSFYALSGYSAAKVGPEKVVESGDRLLVEVPIVEGPRTTLAKLRFEGLESIPEDKVRPQLPLADGGAYHPLLLDDTVNAVRSLYQDEGWEAAQVSPIVTWNGEHTQADVTLQIFEGPRSRVDRVVVRGYRRTRPEVVRRSIDLDPGEPVSPRRLLEVQRGLYRLGIFSRVDVTTAHSGEDESQRDVLVRVEEGHMQRYSYGLGYDSEDGLRGLIGYSHANLFGRALGLQLDARASQRENLFRVLVRQPYVGRFDVPVTYSIFYTEEEREGFNSQRRGTQAEAARVINDVRYGLLYNYRIVDVELPSEEAPPPEIERDLQNIRISSLTPSMLIDHRDDPINATRGWSGAAQLEWAAPLLSAEETFLKFFVQGTWQRTFGRGGVLAASARVGAIEPLSDAAPPDPSLPAGFESAEIPISERFFAGGRTTNRAYARDLLGIRGETLCVKHEPDMPQCLAEGDDENDFDPIGGDGLALANIDYRFSIAGGVGGIVFVDLGNVWQRWQDINPSEAKGGVGVGIRYLSPIGPLRLEVGWKLDREPGESAYEVFLSFGNPF